MQNDLFEDHRKIVAAADDLLAILRQNPDLRIEELNAMRVRLGSLSMAHLRAEEEQIIAPLKASGQLDDIPGAAAVLTAIRNGRSNYSDHIRKWTPQAIAQDRAAYVEALIVLIGLLKALITREETDLYWPALRLLAPGMQAKQG